MCDKDSSSCNDREERQLNQFGNQFGNQPGDQFGPPFGQPFMPGGTDGFGPPFGQPFMPGGMGGFGPPFGQPNAPGGMPGVGGPASSGAPSGPPPSFVPQQSQAASPGILAVDPGAIRPCTFRFVYIWLTSGQQFWAWLIFVGRRSVAGWRWNGFRWVYFGVDLRSIDRFVCY